MAAKFEVFPSLGITVFSFYIFMALFIIFYQKYYQKYKKFNYGNTDILEDSESENLTRKLCSNKFSVKHLNISISDTNNSDEEITIWS